MRFLRKAILTTLLSVATVAASAQNGHSDHDWTRVINAIAQVESGGNPKARSTDCVGLLQIRPVLVRDVNEYLGMRGSKKRFSMDDRYSAEKSKEMFILYQRRYNPRNNIEKAIRIWNGGPGYSVRKTDGYLNRVMAHYNKAGRKPVEKQDSTSVDTTE